MDNNNKTILIVDDAEELREFLNLNLLQKYNVVTSKNGQQALELLADTPVDLIMLDIIMPVMDGIETLEALKSHAQYQQIPVIMITADESMETAMSCLQKGACSYVTKPYEMDHVFSQIEYCLNK